MKKHFCVTVYVINDDKFLMIKHKKLGVWISPGGHIEENESPDDACLREVKEETGIDIQLIGERLLCATDYIRPYAISPHVIKASKKEEEHIHMDLIYFAKPVGELSLKLNENETDGIKWFPINEILSPEFDTFDDVKQWCQRFYEMNQK